MIHSLVKQSWIFFQELRNRIPPFSLVTENLITVPAQDEGTLIVAATLSVTKICTFKSLK